MTRKKTTIIICLLTIQHYNKKAFYFYPSITRNNFIFIDVNNQRAPCKLKYTTTNSRSNCRNRRKEKTQSIPYQGHSYHCKLSLVKSACSSNSHTSSRFFRPTQILVEHLSQPPFDIPLLIPEFMHFQDAYKDTS